MPTLQEQVAKHKAKRDRMRGEQRMPRPATVVHWKEMQLRLLQGLTIAELAGIRGVDPNTVSAALGRMRTHYGASTNMHALLIMLQAEDITLTEVMELNP